MRRLLFFWLFAIASSAFALSISAPALACGAVSAPCSVALGSYQAAAPAHWDGARPLGLLLYFHGYGSSGASAIKTAALVQEAAERNLLLVAPNGLPEQLSGRSSWAHVGSPSRARDELSFIAQVLADVETRWPIDPARRYVAGFSQGGSMVWDLACYRGQGFAGFLPIAGAFWEPLPEDCPAGPVVLRHIHGTADKVVPLAGRPVAGQWRQGDVEQALKIRRAVNGCAEDPDEVTEAAGLSCRVWKRCSSGEPLAFCLHGGGHSFRAAWVGAGIDWIEGLASTAVSAAHCRANQAAVTMTACINSPQ